MATYTLIEAKTLASSAASITFSSIPATYTDLVLKASVRTTASGAFSDLGIVLNGVISGSKYSFTRLLGYGSGASSSVFSGQDAGNISYGNGDTSTSNTFNSLEVYIPLYTSNQNKPFSSITMQENNQTIAYIYSNSQVFYSTTAITSIQITEASGNNLKSGSTFYLYGISNS